jgi:hypothetical protein
MRQTQRETNNAQTRKIEQLIERKKSGEDKTKSVEHYLIFGIIAFCLTLLVVVITSNDSGSSAAGKESKSSESKSIDVKGKDKPHSQKVSH